MTNPSIYHRTILKKQIYSASLQTEREIWVYLPPGYNELLTYPVVYCQDGVEFLNYGRIATATNQLVLEEDMEPPIIVGVHVDLKNRTEEYSPDGERFSAYCRFWTEEMMPEIERSFPIRASAEERILAGDSLGATVSLHLALDHPHLFRKLISLSGAFLPPTRQRLTGESDLGGLDMYMLIGLQETEVKTQRGTFDFLEANRLAKELLTSKGANVYYEEDEGKHLWGFWQKKLPSALYHFLG
ncbi:enterobactin/ferric enterobactin esterase [Chlamydia abortus]|nr:enterobactin/ferric enterobactin esterase [Chlamydia abortus]